MDKHLQEAFLRGFERGLEKDAAVGTAVYGAGRAVLGAGKFLGGLASRVGRWAFTPKTGLPQGVTKPVKSYAKRGFNAFKEKAPGIGLDMGQQVATSAATGKLFDQKPKGVQQGSTFGAGQGLT